MIKKWISLLLAVMLLTMMVPGTLSEGLEIEEEPVIPETEEIDFAGIDIAGDEVDNAVTEEDFMLFSDEPIEKGYADFLTEGEANPSDVPIDAAHFPDANFRAYVLESLDGNGDGALSQKEIDSVHEISVVASKVKSMKGVELFPNLETLECYSNKLKSLDVSKNTALVSLDCSFNHYLSSLDVSQNVSLEKLGCSWNQLTGLDVTHNPKLRELDCIGNQLTKLDLSKNTALSIFLCTDNKLTSLDVSKCASLTLLSCHENQLTSLDVSNNPALETLDFDYNQLTSLDVSKNPALKDLSCSYNQLTSLDVSKTGKLLFLHCEGNEIESLDLSNCGDTLKRVLLGNPDFEKCLNVISIEAEDLYELYFDCYTTLIVDGRIIREGTPAKTDIMFCHCSVKDQTWTGKALEPPVTVKYDDEKLIKDKDYTVSYENNIKVGTASATIKGIGDYEGETSVGFWIKPKGTTISALTGGKKKITVKWKKQAKQVTGYQIEYATKKDFSNTKSVTVKGANIIKTTIKKLKAKKTYYIRIRTYKKGKWQNYYSSWSKAKKIKTK